jgi:Leucine-rich repeat (LRR) protein
VRRLCALSTLAVLGGCASGTGDVPASPLTAAAAVTPAGPVCPGPPGTIVHFPDPNLERVVRVTLGVGPDEALTCALLARIVTLDAPDAGIADLSGIENLVRLGALHVYGNNSVRDVTPLGYLPELADLGLARNDIEDVGPLARVRTLTSLDLYGNPVRDVGPLGALHGLIRLRVGSGVRVVNLGALGSLRLLSRLELVENAVADLTPLASLSQLTRLSLQDNPHLGDLAPLAGFAHLEVLELGGTAVGDLGPVAALARLTTLGIAGTRVFDLAPLIGLAGLSRLDLRSNVQISDVQPLLFHPTFGAGDAMRVEGSGVSCADAAALEARGVVVFSNCP